MPHRVCLTVALLLVASEAASLRATPQAPAKPATIAAQAVPKQVDAKATKAAQDDAEQVANNIAKALGVDTAAHTAPAKAQGNASAGAVTHQKLDVGFADFEKNLTEEISKKLLQSASGPAWNDEMRGEFTKNVTSALKESLKVILKPVKQSIGKTWMALPKDEQKDEYVTTLKQSFVDVFAKSQKAIDSHLELSLKRVEDLKEKTDFNKTQILQKAEFSIADSLMTEHCYEVDAKKSLKSMKTPANKTEVQADKKKFCIQSVIGALAHRLNDTQGLISMSMRFESGAMSLAQKKQKGH